MKNNPLNLAFNQQIDFKSLKAGHIKLQAESVQISVNQILSEIYSLKKSETTFENTLLRLDDIYTLINNLLEPVVLLAYVHPNDAIRAEALEYLSVLENFYHSIELDENLYKVIKLYSQTADIQTLSNFKRKFLNDVLRNFKKNGFDLTPEKRVKLKPLKNRESELANEFETNIIAHKDFLLVGEEEVLGLPDDYKQQHRHEDGKYKIKLDYPSFKPFMQYSEAEAARKALLTKFKNRATDKNLKILKQVLDLRYEISQLIGYQTFAEYELVDKMAQNTQNVWNFEDRLMKKVRPKAEADYRELLEIKSEHRQKKATVINSWEAEFYINRLLKQSYSVDNEQIKEYFELNNLIAGVFEISNKLFAIEFREVENPAAWHKQVRQFQVYEQGSCVASFYLDLFPREHKYGHAAMFSLIDGKQSSQGYQLPISALVCNFPEPTPDKPSLLSHDDVITFFHEFGHLLHSLLTRSALTAFSGTSVARDFVETPSQMFENWAWNYEALSLFARHYKTGEIIPKQLFNKMLQAKNVASGLTALQQIFYGNIDMTFHDRLKPDSPKTTTDVVRELQNQITLYPFMEGTYFEASFGHLMGYASGYYGYLWSKVYSEDIFSVFEQAGGLNPKIGLRFRESILAKGADEEPMALLKNFLQREPKEDAFLKFLGI